MTPKPESIRHAIHTAGAMPFSYLERPDGLYQALIGYSYWSPRYKRWVRIKLGQVRDGASGAWDILSLAWWIHDQLCADATWEDGTPVTPWEAANVLRDVLLREGRWFRASSWFITTLALGCKHTRSNT